VVYAEKAGGKSPKKLQRKKTGYDFGEMNSGEDRRGGMGGRRIEKKGRTRRKHHERQKGELIRRVRKA